MKNPEFLTKAEIARAVAGGYRNQNGDPVWIGERIAHEIAERIAAASFAKGSPEPELPSSRVLRDGMAEVPAGELAIYRNWEKNAREDGNDNIRFDELIHLQELDALRAANGKGEATLATPDPAP